MKIEYALTESDFLEYQLYTTSKSEAIKKNDCFSNLLFLLCIF